MNQIIHDLKIYLCENFGDKKDFLILQDISLSSPVVKKKESSIVVNHIPKKLDPITPELVKAVQKETEEDEVSTPLSFIAEIPKAEALSPDSEMSALYKKIAPHMKLSSTPLKDDVAKQIRLASNKRSDLPEIPVLFDHSIQEHLDFLTNLAKAINTSFGTSSVVHIHEFEEKNLWKPLLAHSQIRLIIIPSSLLKHSPNLHTLCKEYPGRLLKSALKIPLLTLSEISDSPIRKKEIWSTLTRFFTKLKT